MKPAMAALPDQTGKPPRWRALLSHLLPPLVGLLETLLLARLLARLFAARPDNPAMQVLYLLTAPLVQPLRGLDAGQPLYGAVLEVSTLALLVALPLVGLLLWWLLLPDGARVAETSTDKAQEKREDR